MTNNQNGQKDATVLQLSINVQIYCLQEERQLLTLYDIHRSCIHVFTCKAYFVNKMVPNRQHIHLWCLKIIRELSLMQNPLWRDYTAVQQHRTIWHLWIVCIICSIAHLKTSILQWCFPEEFSSSSSCIRLQSVLVTNCLTSLLCVRAFTRAYMDVSMKVTPPIFSFKCGAG